MSSCSGSFFRQAVCAFFTERKSHTPRRRSSRLSDRGRVSSYLFGAFGVIAPYCDDLRSSLLAFSFPFSLRHERGLSYGIYLRIPGAAGTALLRIHMRRGFGLYFTSSLLLTAVLAS